MKTRFPYLRFQVISLALFLLAAFIMGATINTAQAQETKEAKWLNVIGMLPLPGEYLDGRIAVFFDDEIVLPQEARGRQAPPLSIQPNMEGRFKTGHNYIVFTPHGNWHRNAYRILLNSGIRSANGKELNPKDREFVFSTGPFVPNRIWCIEDVGGKTTFGILFPRQVSRDVLRKNISVRSKDRESVPFKLEAGSNSETTRLVLEDNTEWPVTITVGKGMVDSRGLWRADRDFSYSYPSDSTLHVNSVKWDVYSQKNQRIRVNFSRKVLARDIKHHLSITDNETGAEYSFLIATSGNRNYHVASLELAQPEHAKVDVRVSQGLPGSERSTLRSDYSRTIENRLMPLLISSAYWNNYGRDGLVLNLRLNKAVEFSELKAHLKVTPTAENMRIEPTSYGMTMVYADWESETSYRLEITSGLVAKDGVEVTESVARDLHTPKANPRIEFTHDGKYYFPKRGGKGPAIRSSSIKKAKLKLFRMFPSNIAASLRDMRDGEGGHTFDEAWCEELETRDIDLVYGRKRMEETLLDIKDLFPSERKGVFGIEVADAQRGYPRDTKMVLMTDMGLVAHWQKDELVVFVHDLMSLEPLKRAKITVYSKKNQLLGIAKTGRNGVAHLTSFATDLGMPAVIVAEHGNDYTFLELKHRNDPSNPIGAGMSTYDSEAYDAFVYADRDLYRPGDTVHLRWLVSTNYGNAAPELPLLLTVVKPNGKNLISEPTTLSALGTGNHDLETQKTYPTGSYTAKLSIPGEKKPIGAYRFKIEEFVPNRMRIDVSTSDTNWINAATYEVKVKTEHLFGAPAANRKCDVRIEPNAPGSVFEKWAGYTFGNDSRVKLNKISLGEMKTDEDGIATFSHNFRAPADFTSPVRASIVAKTYELGGRPVVARTNTRLFPSNICLGLTAKTATDGEGIDVAVAAIKPDQAPAELETVKITLEKQVWNYYVRRYYSHHSPNWSESFEVMETRDVKLTDGVGSVKFDVKNYGRFRIRVHSASTPQFSTRTLYFYRGGCRLVDSGKPGLIDISLDKAHYKPGDVAEIKLESPFDGKGIVVIQQASILEMIPVDIKNNEGIAHFKIREEHVPNIWVETTVVHAIQKEHAQVYPFSSFAMVSLPIKDPKRRVDVKLLSLPEEIMPAEAKEFVVEVTDWKKAPVEAEVTLAAVDEGIHLLTNYRDPDPCGWFMRTRQPELRRAHYYDRVAYDFDEPEAGGGSGAGAIEKRVASMGENWIRSVALWSGTVMTDKNGIAKVILDVPEFTGQLRLVAVARTAKAVGAVRKDLLVRRPHMLRTNMPRFMLPGDMSACRAVLFNNTEVPCKVRVSWKASGMLEKVNGSAILEVPPGGEANAVANIVAGVAAGQGQLEWKAEFMDDAGNTIEGLSEIAPIPVRPPAAFQSRHELVVLKPGETRSFRNTAFIESDINELEISVGANPMLRLEKAFKYAVRYPYGCLEQTTSKLLPMYLLRKNAELMDPKMLEGSPIDYYIQSGIDKLFSMQTVSGGLSYWPASNHAYPYGSTYALHFLSLVKNDREFEIPAEHFKLLQDFVRGIIRNWNGKSSSDLYRRAYAVYILALGGDLEAIKEIERFDDIVVPRAARYLLAAALAQHTKDSDRVSMYLKSRPHKEYNVRERDGTLNSEIKNTAVELIALQQIEDQPRLMAEKADKLVAFLEARKHGNTHETALIISALAGYFSDIAENEGLASAVIRGPEKETKIGGADTYRGACEGKDRLYEVANMGKANIFVNFTS
ncbi:alpha-2-macroglobulin, partial [Candidatus Hydrogenedentota bacterium]